MNRETTDKSDKKTILVVDDTPDNLRVLSAMLSENGYRVGKALGGQVALMASKNLLPDLILLDINMPEMDGYEVCQHLKENEITCNIPVIFISALDDVLDKVKAFEVGGADYITKPFKGAEVILRIENQLKLRSLHQSLQEKNLALEQEVQERKQAQMALEQAVQEYQKTQVALELSEAKNLVLLNAIPDLMLRLSANGTLLDYRRAKSVPSQDPKQITNLVPKFKDRRGASQAEQICLLLPRSDDPEWEQNFVGKNVSDVLPSDWAMWIMHYVEQTMLTSDIQVGEFVQQIDDDWRGFEARFVKSGCSEVLAIVRDISERKQAEAQRLQAEALLQRQKQQLEQALSDLKEAQSQLVHNEKMVGLGQLVAGIAHEINNPISFIYGNIVHVNDYVRDLIHLLDIYQQDSYKQTQAQALSEDLDLCFIKEDVQKILESMQTGAERIRQIVISLRNFARLDEAEMKPVDIHEGIASTLLLLQHRLHENGERPAIQVIQEYGGLPKVICYASQLNQVFFNLLNNAIDALEGQGYQDNISIPNPQIQIRTELRDANTVFILIADNGPGIPESVRSRLFDPFFTTKPPGYGRGLGLSISYQIISQKHRGRLMCCSSPGEGAKFAIEIPVSQPTHQ